MPDSKIMRINICMVTYNRLALTRRAVESLLENTPESFTLHIVDNASTDGTREYLAALAAERRNVRVFSLRRNMGVAVGANVGWAAMPADYYIKFDNDIVVENPRWLATLIDLAEKNPEIGQVGHLCGDWPYEIKPERLGGGGLLNASGCVNGGCVLIPQKTHERLGFWNEDYGLYGFEDLDYSERAAQAGLRAGYLPDGGFVRHLGYEAETREQNLEESKNAAIASKSRGERIFVLNRFMFRQGLRPLYVERKYLPRERGGALDFSDNQNYRALARLQEELLAKLNYSIDEQGVSLDVAALSLTGPAFSPK